MPIKDVAALAGITTITARKYLKLDFNPASADYGNKKPGKINPFTETIDQMLCDRRTFREIKEAIRKLGYDGTESTVRMYATRKRRTIKEQSEKIFAKTEIIERKWLISLLYKAEHLHQDIKDGALSRAIHKYPVIGKLYDIVGTFKKVLSDKCLKSMDAWIQKVRDMGIDLITAFITGITRDFSAVQNAVQYDYNNGLAEGKVNKLKLLKRVMYGRSSFNLLRTKRGNIGQAKKHTKRCCFWGKFFV